MDSLADAETGQLLCGRSDWIEPDQLAALSDHPLACIDTEFPHFVGSAESPDDVERPAESHPVFYGCFDWHSAVHSHWALVRQRRLFADHPDAARIERRLDERFTAENVSGEVAYFEENEGFEEPYGWAWFLRLVAELHLWNDDPADVWRAALEPLEDQIVSLAESEVLVRDRPIRVGTHGNSAFALASILDYARVTDNDALESATVETSLSHYRADTDYPIEYEPLGWDFFSPGLTEAALMARVLEQHAFAEWIEGFLPDIADSTPDVITRPVDVEAGTDDGMELHLVGLNLSRAWCLATIADALGDHPWATIFERGAGRHAERGISRAFTDEYAGAHWLSSFVLYLLTRNDGGIATA